jgi:hypothetical protein
MGETQKGQARAGRDIGPIPPIKDPRRRKRALGSLLYFLRTYLAAAFPLPFSDDQKKVIAKIDHAVMTGGKFAEAMPRGSGKSTICEGATLWAALKGRRKFIVLIAAVADFGVATVDSIASEIEHNDLLLEDFPEVVFPFRALEQSNNRAKGQRCLGVLTEIRRTSGKLVFPTIPGSLSSGVVIVGTGIEGGKLRGLRHKLPDGRVIRPDMIIADDLQTDETANSQGECVKREKAITGKILGMAGPGMLPAAIVCGTVIRRGDVMDNLLDRSKHPEWQGERMKLIYSFPTDTALWDEYARILGEDLATGGTGSKATALYRKNRAAMDKGGVVAWKHRKAEGELSALEHAMKLFYRDREVFFAEYQNEPVVEEAAKRIMSAKEIADKQNGMRRGDVAEGVSRLVAFIDVHLELLYWLVMAWEENFTGYIVDYGTYPDQHRSYFMLREVKHTLAAAAKNQAKPGAVKAVGMEGAIYAGLEATVNMLAGREFLRVDGAAMRVDRIAIDANWGQTTSLVKQFCRQSIHSGLILPSHGHYYGARHKPLSQYEKRPGERLDRDYMWQIPKAPHRQVRHIVWDSNWWKSFSHARLGVAMGDLGCVSVFAGDHRLLADHLTSELPTLTEGHGRKLDEWEQRPGTDNHWFDCFVGCNLLARERGCSLEALSHSHKRAHKEGTKRMTYSELQRQKRQGRV